MSTACPDLIRVRPAKSVEACMMVRNVELYSRCHSQIQPKLALVVGTMSY